MYIIVAKKTEKDGNEFPIVTALKWYFMKNKDDIILVSPGYMSTTDKTIQEFCDKFKNLSENVDCQIILSIGMNGTRLVEGTSMDIMQRHYDYFKKKFPPFSTKKDHSKFLIFIENNDDFVSTYENDASSLVELLKDDKTVIKAILLGSSNFSNNTYFSERADKGEADILMVAEKLYIEEDFVRSFGEFYNREQTNGRIILSKELGTKQDLKTIANKLLVQED